MYVVFINEKRGFAFDRKQGAYERLEEEKEELI